MKLTPKCFPKNGYLFNTLSEFPPAVIARRAKARRSNPTAKIASSQLSLNLLEEVGIVMFSSKLNIKEKHTLPAVARNDKSVSSGLNKYKNGFTLIELVMTIVIASIVAIPLSLLVSQHFAGVAQSSAYSIVVNLARFEMEKVNNIDYANIDTMNSPNYEGTPYDVTRTVTFIQGDAASAESLKQIQVDVKGAGSPAVLFSLVTYLAGNVGYGI